MKNIFEISLEFIDAISGNDLLKIKKILNNITISELENVCKNFNFLVYALRKKNIDVLYYLMKKGANPMCNHDNNDSNENFFELFFKLITPLTLLSGGTTIVYQSSILLRLNKTAGTPQPPVQTKIMKNRINNNYDDPIYSKYEDELKKCVRSLMIQKKLFSKVPSEQLSEIILQFNKHNILHPKLHQKYGYILAGNDLALL